MGSLARKFIGQDMTRVSMPVIINEPLGTLQKTCEMLVLYEQLLVRAAKHQDPLMRLTLATTAIVAGLNCVRVVRKKPFNPVLGETFEYVSE
jgi:oxysterol-binding protein-related protein 3/6/7